MGAVDLVANHRVAELLPSRHLDLVPDADALGPCDSLGRSPHVFQMRAKLAGDLLLRQPPLQAARDLGGENLRRRELGQGREPGLPVARVDDRLQPLDRQGVEDDLPRLEDVADLHELPDVELREIRGRGEEAWQEGEGVIPFGLEGGGPMGQGGLQHAAGALVSVDRTVPQAVGDRGDEAAAEWGQCVECGLVRDHPVPRVGPGTIQRAEQVPPNRLHGRLDGVGRPIGGGDDLPLAVRNSRAEAVPHDRPLALTRALRAAAISPTSGSGTSTPNASFT